MDKMTKPVLGKVYLVGAGPGCADLLTLKGKRCLEKADIVAFDRLVDPSILDLAPADAELIYVGKASGRRCVAQREIEMLLIDHARRGRSVVRLKGGDPFVFGRGGEEMEALSRAGVPFEVVPGVSSALAVPAYAGIPLTHRNYASSVAIVTGHRGSRSDEIKWNALGQAVDTLVILMGLGNLRENMSRLMEGGCDPRKPVAVVCWGARASQEILVATVGTVADWAEYAGLKPPAVIVVGEVVRLRERLDWLMSEVELSSARQERAQQGYAIMPLYKATKSQAKGL